MPAVNTFAVPNNAITMEISEDDGSPTYAAVGCVLSVDQWPEKRTEGEEVLCLTDTDRLKKFTPTHMTLGQLEMTMKWSETGLGALQALHGIDATTKAFKSVLMKIKIKHSTPASTDNEWLAAGYLTHVTPEPQGDGSGIQKFKVGMQVTSDPAYTYGT